MSPACKFFSVFIMLSGVMWRLYAGENLDTITRKFEQFGAKQGLSQGFVRWVIQDREGYMWFCSKDGLNKYDGYRVTVYRHDPADTYSLPDNYVTRIEEDDNGNFWVGTDTKGLCLFDKKSERFYRINSGQKTDNIANTDIYDLKYKNGLLLVRSDAYSILWDVSSLTPKNCQKTPLRNILDLGKILNAAGLKGDVKVNGLISTTPDSLWIMVPNKMLFSCWSRSEKKWNVFAFDDSIFGLHADEIHHKICAIIGTKKLIFSDYNHMVVFNTATGRTEFKRNFYNSDIKCLHVSPDLHGNISVQSDFTTYLFNPVTHKFTVAKSDLQAVYAQICVDRGGVLWTTGNADGAFKFYSRTELFRNISAFISVFRWDSCGYSISLDNRHHSNYYLYGPGNRKLKKVDWLDEFIANRLETLTNIGDRKTEIWLKSRGASPTVIKYNIQTGKRAIFKSPPPGLDDLGYILTFFIDSAGRTWFFNKETSRRPNILILDESTGKTAHRYYFPALKDHNEYPFVSDVWQDKEGTTWMGTLQGLFSFNEARMEWHQWKSIPGDTTSLTTDMIFSLCPDSQQPGRYLWVGTNGGGLNRFEFATGKFIHYSTKDGLPNDVIYGILNDETGNLWLSSNSGITCFNPSVKPGTLGRFRTFTTDDGLPGNEFNRYEFYKSGKDEMVFGGVAGTTIFNPSEVLKEGPLPNVVLTGLSLFNQPFNYKSDTTIINRPIGYAKAIRLPYNKNMFTLEFAALDFSPPSQKRYKYMLEGFNTGWIDNGNLNTATFTNLDPGTYTFRVKASLRDGAWSPMGATILIVITPPWWATWWFRMAAAIAIVAVIYSIYRYRLRQAFKFQSLRNNIASDLHDEIGSTLSSISLASTIMQKKMTGRQIELQPLLEQISRNTDNMMEAMSDIVWAINTKNDRFDNVISRVLGFATELLEPLDCKIDIRVPPHLDSIVLDMQQRKNLYLIFKEAINNAAKYADCKTVVIDISMAPDKHLKVSIKDDGKGFVQPSNRAVEYKMGGNGIKNMQERARELKGSLQISTGHGRGTEIVLVMPI